MSERDVTPEDITNGLTLIAALQELRALIQSRFGGTSEAVLLDAQVHVTLRTVYELIGLLTWTLQQQGGAQDAQ
jgi:hypothetical protein